MIFFFAPSDSRFFKLYPSQILPYILKKNIQNWNAYLFSFQMMYESLFLTHDFVIFPMTGFVVQCHICNNEVPI